MWATLTVFDGPVAADGTYFFNYFQIEQSDAAGTYESFSCWAPYEAERESVPPEDVRVVNYYGELEFYQGQETVEKRTMEFINAEDKVPNVEEQIWKVVEEKLATSYATVYDGENKKSS